MNMLRSARFLKRRIQDTGIPLEIIQIATYLTHQNGCAFYWR